MKKNFFLVFLAGLLLTTLNSQDTLLFVDGQQLVTDITKIDRRYVFYTGDTAVERVNRSEVEVRFGEDYLYRRPWSISLTLESTLLGSGQEWKNLLADHGFGYLYTTARHRELENYGFECNADWCRGVREEYPQRRPSSINFQLRMLHRYRPQRAYGLSLYAANSGSVTGYNASPYGFGFLNLSYGQWGMSTYHQWFLGQDDQLGVYVGPNLQLVQVNFDPGSREYPSRRDRSWQAGLTLGTQLTLLERVRHYMRLNLQYNLVSPLQVGQYQLEGTITDDDGTRTELVTLIPDAEIGLNSFAVGLVVGVRLGERK
jgi:hypothetical protein